MNIHVKPAKAARPPVYIRHNRTRLLGFPSFRALSPDIRLWPSLAASASRPAPHARAPWLASFATTGRS